MQLPVTAPPFPFFFDPSSHVHGPPPFHLWVFVLRLLPRSSERRHSADKHLFMSSLVAHRAFVFHPAFTEPAVELSAEKGFPFYYHKRFCISFFCKYVSASESAIIKWRRSESATFSR